MILINPSGKLVDVPDSDLQKASNAGYRAPTAKELQDFQDRRTAAAQPIQAGLEGLARGASAGLSDVYLKHALPDGQGAGMGARRELNSMAATAGEVVGTLAGSVAGPVKGAGMAGEAVAAEAGLEGIKKVAVSHGVQGGLWGLGSAISEASLGDTELTGQNLAAAALAGGITNAALGSAFHGLSVGASALAKKAALPAVGDMLSGAADKAEMHALGISGHPEAEALLGKARDNGLLGITGSPAQVAEKAQALRGEAAKKVGDLLAQADTEMTNGGLLPPSVPELEARVGKALAPFRRVPTNDAAVAQVEKVVGGFAEREGRMSPMTWEDLFQTQEGLDGSNDVVKAAKAAIRSYVEEGADASLPPWRRGQFAKALEDYGHFSTLADKSAANAAGHDLGNAIGYGGLGLVMGHPAAGIAAGIAKKALQPRAGFIAGAALRKLSESGMLEKVADTFRNQVMDKLSALPFAVQQRLTDAAARGSMEMLSEHVRLAQSDPGYLQALGLQNETPTEIANLGPRLAALHSTDEASRAVSQQFDEAVGKFFGSPGRPGRVIDTKPTLREFDAVKLAVDKLVRNSEAVYQTMPEELTSHAPATAGSAALAVVNAAKFLQDKAPKDPNAGLPASIRRPWTPSRMELSRWFRYVDAIEHPAEVLQRARKGAVPPEYMEALQAVYPRLLEETRMRMTEALGAWGKPLPYARRVGASALLGPAVLPMTREQVALIQQNHATVAPPALSKPDGRQHIDAAKNMQTQAQRIEGR